MTVRSGRAAPPLQVTLGLRAAPLAARDRPRRCHGAEPIRSGPISSDRPVVVFDDRPADIGPGPESGGAPLDRVEGDAPARTGARPPGRIAGSRPLPEERSGRPPPARHAAEVVATTLAPAAGLEHHQRSNLRPLARGDQQVRAGHLGAHLLPPQRSAHGHPQGLRRSAQALHVAGLVMGRAQDPQARAGTHRIGELPPCLEEEVRRLVRHEGAEEEHPNGRPRSSLDPGMSSRPLPIHAGGLHVEPRALGPQLLEPGHHEPRREEHPVRTAADGGHEVLESAGDALLEADPPRMTGSSAARDRGAHPRQPPGRPKRPAPWRS